MLRTRVITALVLLAVLLAVLFYLPVGAAVGFLLAAVLVGAWEWAAFAGLTRPAGRLGYVLATAALCALAWRQTPRTVDWLLWMKVAAAWWVLALLWLGLRPHAVNRIAAALAGLVVLVTAWLGLARLLLVVAPVQGAALLLYMLLLVWAADIGGYFAGRRYGRLRLAPEVSPNKTWEGVVGGALLGLLVAVLGALWFRAPIWSFALLGLAVVGTSVIGDLTESMFKRFAHLKDSGALLPGHGGVLDRIDSITSAVPFFVLGLSWCGFVG